MKGKMYFTSKVKIYFTRKGKYIVKAMNEPLIKQVKC